MQDLTRAVQRPVATKSKGRAQASKRATSMPVATREIVSGCKLCCGLLGCPWKGTGRRTQAWLWGVWWPMATRKTQDLTRAVETPVAMRAKDYM